MQHDGSGHHHRPDGWCRNVSAQPPEPLLNLVHGAFPGAPRLSLAGRLKHLIQMGAGRRHRIGLGAEGSA